MRITREKHMAYIIRLMPLLAAAYVLQCCIYFQFAPQNIVIDVSIFLAVGIVLIALGFAFYDHAHKVQLYRNHLVTGLDWPNYQEEILYRHIVSMEIEATKHAFYNVVLELQDGRKIKLYYLDDIEELKQLVRNSS